MLDLVFRRALSDLAKPIHYAFTLSFFKFIRVVVSFFIIVTTKLRCLRLSLFVLFDVEIWVRMVVSIFVKPSPNKICLEGVWLQTEIGSTVIFSVLSFANS